ncbi:kelch-like protein 17 [Galendromus occidentalis]|uniref:Kelch-like protein diablo n=1 Tax=Galendromus occidentalis TaxID=34638 RepID=A0AAJ6W066_9ACAR|nr:kelch-like protein 17 [Galendromus occidentalis]
MSTSTASDSASSTKSRTRTKNGSEGSKSSSVDSISEFLQNYDFDDEERFSYSSAHSLRRDANGRKETSIQDMAEEFNPSHLASAFRNLNTMRESSQLCDVTLKTTDSSIGLPCHKIVLAFSSPYFLTMFNSKLIESTSSEIVIHDVDHKSLKTIVDYCYCGNLYLCTESVQPLLQAACLLQMEKIIITCVGFFLLRLDPTNCIGVRALADTLSLQSLQSSADFYIVRNFRQVVKSEEFLQLTASEVERLLSDNRLNVPGEEVVFQAIMRWVKHSEKRICELGRLLKQCRLPRLPRNFLMNEVAENPLVKESDASKDLLIDAMKYHLMPDKRTEMRSAKTTIRTPYGLSPYILAVGGGSLFAIHSDCEFYDYSADRWCHFESTIHRRSRAGVLACDRLVYAIGGFDGIKDLAAVEVFSPYSGHWTSLSPMSCRRSCLGAAALNGLIYVGGGFDGYTCLSTVERYDPLVGVWTTVQSMDHRRRYGRLEAHGDCIYAVGGHDGSNYLNTVERFDPREGKWQSLPPISFRRNSAGVASLGDYLYVAGGNDSALCLNSAERFCPKTNSWQMISNMGCRRTTHSLLQMHHSLYALGGNDGNSSLNTVEIFKPKENKWIPGTSMQLRRGSLGAAVVEAICLESPS